MNRIEDILLAGFIAFYLIVFGLYHLMVSKANQQLPPHSKIPRSLAPSVFRWNSFATEYKRVFPRSLLYKIALTCAVADLIIALFFVGFRIWLYTR